jgi:hypothetical protein
LGGDDDTSSIASEERWFYPALECGCYCSSPSVACILELLGVMTHTLVIAGIILETVPYFLSRLSYLFHGWHNLAQEASRKLYLLYC